MRKVIIIILTLICWVGLASANNVNKQILSKEAVIEILKAEDYSCGYGVEWQWHIWDMDDDIEDRDPGTKGEWRKEEFSVNTDAIPPWNNPIYEHKKNMPYPDYDGRFDGEIYGRVVFDCDQVATSVKMKNGKIETKEKVNTDIPANREKHSCVYVGQWSSDGEGGWLREVIPAVEGQEIPIDHPVWIYVFGMPYPRQKSVKLNEVVDRVEFPCGEEASVAKPIDKKPPSAKKSFQGR